MFHRHLVMAIALVLFTAGWAQADINAYLHGLNVSAQGNLGGFRTEVGARFGASGPQVDIALRSADSPADAAVCLWLAQQSRQPVDVVLREYRASKNQGWGTLAKNLGIKPGSAAFKKLKRGDLGWQPAAGAGGHGKKSGRGKGKGNGKGRS